MQQVTKKFPLPNEQIMCLLSFAARLKTFFYGSAYISNFEGWAMLKG